MQHELSTDFIKIHPDNCIGCWRCIRKCPANVIGKVGFLWHKHAVIINAEACIGCENCINACPRNCYYKI